MKFTTLGRGVQPDRGIARRGVRTAAEWSTLWQQHAGMGKPPAVDFTVIVIAVFLGSRQSAGYTVEITRIEKTTQASWSPAASSGRRLATWSRRC